MRAVEFIDYLGRIRPTVDQLKNAGCSQSIIETIISFYRFEKRSIKNPITHSSSDEIIELLASHDLSGLEIGTISFMDMPIIDHYGISFAKDESDPLYVSENGTIVIRQLHKLDHIICNVAKDSEHFLDMFITYIKYARDVQLNLIDYNDLDKAKIVSDECTTKAGGEQYRNFCSALFGI
jgi:hypothetical protein